MFKKKVKTPPDFPPITIIDPDDQPMWSSNRTVAPTPSFAIIQLHTLNNFVIKDDPTQAILDAGGIFLYKTPNEAFKILEDKVLLKIDFSKSSPNNPNPKTVVFTGGSNVTSDQEILMGKLETLVTKNDIEFMNIRG
nr:reverse transcriptase domain-containing protein [Tanacetum cinerariifolium]